MELRHMPHSVTALASDRAYNSTVIDYIEWSHKVLAATIEAHSKSGSMRSIGVDERVIAVDLFVDRDVMAADFHSSPQRLAMLSALRGLTALGLLDENSSRGFYKPSSRLMQLNGDFLPLWRDICEFRLAGEQEEFLRVIAPLSEVQSDDFSSSNSVAHEVLLGALGLAELDDAWHVAKMLDEADFIKWSATHGAFNAQITYSGLVWLRKQGETKDAEEIDRLVTEWETTSVEFKRELGTGTVDQKAELVKDLSALVNTQASGQRWLIIGFDPKTHEHVAGPDPLITQDHLEQLVSAYIEPNLAIRYSVVDYRGSEVGKLEVIRVTAKVPYSAKKELRGMKRTISVGDWFVRHGSQVEVPTPAERQAIVDEGNRARL